MKTTLTLARWLGPWADPRHAPEVATTDEQVGDRLFHPAGRPRRTFLIAPGLHYAGTDDPRLDRFCRILARAGHLVVAPNLPAYLALTPGEQAKREFFAVAAALPRWTSHAPVVFSISFGSLLAFALAAEHPDRVERLVVFGGYAQFREMMRFCLTGELASGRTAARDPLNQPVVLINLAHLLGSPDPAALIAAWRAYVEQTWGRPELKQDGAALPIAEQLASTLAAPLREHFLLGVGARPGSAPWALEALARFDDRALDPRPYLSRVRCRVDLVHGLDDDVVPFEHAVALGAALPDARVHLTGLYGHAAIARPGLGALARELATMVRVLLAMR